MGSIQDKNIFLDYVGSRIVGMESKYSGMRIHAKRKKRKLDSKGNSEWEKKENVRQLL